MRTSERAVALAVMRTISVVVATLTLLIASSATAVAGAGGVQGTIPTGTAPGIPVPNASS
jgi:hypothetical protein